MNITIDEEENKMNKENLTISRSDFNSDDWEKIQSLIESSKKKKDIFARVEEGDTFFYVEYDGTIDTFHEENGLDDDNLYNVGNYSTDAEYIKNLAKETRKLWKLTRWARILNGDWKPDWSNTTNGKLSLYYDTTNKTWNVDLNWFNEPLCIYFKSTELAQKCIDEYISKDEDFKME